jgi:RND family efflux transporter MFP subunit
MKTKIHNLGIYAVLALVALLPMLTSCSQGQAKASMSPPPPPAVTVSNPLQKTVTQYAEYSGTIRPIESVVIRPRVEGVLEEIHFTPGTTVNEGDLLYSLDARPYQRRLEEAEADLAISKANLNLAETTSHRMESAFKDNAVSEVSVIEAKANFATAEAVVAAAIAKVKRAKLNLSYTQIKAPIDGRIGQSLIDAGNLVGTGNMSTLTTIVQDDTVLIYFSVSEKEFLDNKQQFDALISSDKGSTPAFLGLSRHHGYPYQGRIDYIDNQLDAESGTILIRGIFTNSDHKLLPGLFARVRVPLNKANDELLVPDTAFGRNQEGHYLFVLDKENKVLHRPVLTGALIEGMRIVSEGISPEDRIIVNGLQKARPGAPVTPVGKEPLALKQAKVVN